mgnify:FL=1
MDGEVIRMPAPGKGGQTGDSIDTRPATVMHPLDTADAVPRRTKEEILEEGLLLVPNLAKLLFRLLIDGRIPVRRRLALVVAAGYVGLPVDLVPDAIPVLGAVDDLLVLALAIDYMLRSSLPEIVEEHWDGSEEALELVRGVAAWGVEMIPDRLRRLVSLR